MEVLADVDAEGFHALLGYGADAGDAGDGECTDEFCDFVGRDDCEAIGFLDVAGDFGEECVGGDAGRGGEGGFFEDSAAYFVGDERCAALEKVAVGDVDEGFVEREWFDEFGKFHEDRMNDLAGFAVFLDVGGD